MKDFFLKHLEKKGKESQPAPWSHTSCPCSCQRPGHWDRRSGSQDHRPFDCNYRSVRWSRAHHHSPMTWRLNNNNVIRQVHFEFISITYWCVNHRVSRAGSPGIRHLSTSPVMADIREPGLHAGEVVLQLMDIIVQPANLNSQVSIGCNSQSQASSITPEKLGTSAICKSGILEAWRNLVSQYSLKTPFARDLSSHA